MPSIGRARRARETRLKYGCSTCKLRGPAPRTASVVFVLLRACTQACLGLLCAE